MVPDYIYYIHMGKRAKNEDSEEESDFEGSAEEQRRKAAQRRAASDSKKTKKGKLKKITGRPRVTESNGEHEEFFCAVKLVFEVVASIVRLLKGLKGQQQGEQPPMVFKDSQGFGGIFSSNEFLKAPLTNQKRYASKHGLLFQLHYLKCHWKTFWSPSEILDYLLFFFHQQGVMTTELLEQAEIWRDSGRWADSLLNGKQEGEDELLSLFVLLAIEISAFEDLSFIIPDKTMSDPI